jgi:hypothetical protein
MKKYSWDAGRLLKKKRNASSDFLLAEQLDTTRFGVLRDIPDI